MSLVNQAIELATRRASGKSQRCSTLNVPHYRRSSHRAAFAPISYYSYVNTGWNRHTPYPR